MRIVAVGGNVVWVFGVRGLQKVFGACKNKGKEWCYFSANKAVLRCLKTVSRLVSTRTLPVISMYGTLQCFLRYS